MSRKSAAFFFGSGVSRPSKAPMMDEITKAALNHDWEEHTNSRFYPARVTPGKEARRVKQFLHLLKSNIVGHLRSHDERESNYEDLYSSALQIVQDERQE